MNKLRISAIFAALAGLGTFLAITPGIANAQDGSRLCGRYMVAPTNDKAVTHLYEVPKNEIQNTACDQALNKRVDTPPLAIENNLNTNDFSTWTTRGSFQFVKCEDFRNHSLLTGGLEGHNIEFQGDGWPSKDAQDICNSMERSDGYTNLHSYWLAWYGGPLLYLYNN
jgi:hypothetical protein